MLSALNIPASVRKATQALNYFALLSASGSPCAEINRLKALKLLFFADRYHLRRYGRPVSDCAYFAMKNGPVASEAKHITEENPRLGRAAHAYARRFVRKENSLDYRSIAASDPAVLSGTDLEALDFAWKNFGHYTQFKLANITHHYPEWKRHEGALRRGERRVAMEYADFFSEPDAGYNPCHELKAKEREVARELFLDHVAAAQRWS